jgi:phosphate transport system substrate-binding protein
VIEKTLAALLAGTAMLTVSAFAAQASELRVHGAATVANGIIVPNQAAIEQETGLTLALVANGSGNGLQDLVGGRADVAMIAAPIEVEQALLNAATPGALDIAGLESHSVGVRAINFIVNASNPVQTLTEDQLRGIFSGSIANWSEVGGPDMPIQVFIEVNGNGTRANVESTFLAGAGFAASAREVPALAQLAQVVSQAPNAIAYGNPTSIIDGVAVVAGVEVAQPLAIVTTGAPTPEEQALIDSVAHFGAL